MSKGTQFVTYDEHVLYGSVAKVAHEWQRAASPPSFAHGAASVTAASPASLETAPELPPLPLPLELPLPLLPPELLPPELLPLLELLASGEGAGAGLLLLLHATTSAVTAERVKAAAFTLRSQWFAFITAPRNSRSGKLGSRLSCSRYL